jgi:hypothetical protein
MAWERIMSTHITMQTHAANYLSERRRLGFALRSPGYSVTSFARYVDALNLQEPLTVEIMADWARRDTGNLGATIEESALVYPLPAAV